MGWKAVKDHYRIEHNVAVFEGEGICVGSGYVHNIIVISPEGVLDDKKAASLGVRGETARIKAEMEADPEKLRELATMRDTFGETVSVYTYDRSGVILRKQAEQVGYPNPTTDGEMQYENTHSADRDEVVRWAMSNARARIRAAREWLRDAEDNVRRRRDDKVAAEAALQRLLSAEYPETMFRNHYRCPNGHEWTDDWSCQCDDDCPACGARHITPHHSEEIA